MTLQEARKVTTQRDVQNMLQPFMASEAIEILARTMAHIVHRDPRQFPALTNLFREAFSAEHKYLCTRPAPGGPDAYHRSTGASHE
jgi:hypothetical protein